MAASLRDEPTAGHVQRTDQHLLCKFVKSSSVRFPYSCWGSCIAITRLTLSDQHSLLAGHLQSVQQSYTPQNSVPQRDADLLHLWTAVERAAPGTEKAHALARLSAEASKRVVTDVSVRAAVHALLHRRRTGTLLQVCSTVAPS